MSCPIPGRGIARAAVRQLIDMARAMADGRRPRYQRHECRLECAGPRDRVRARWHGRAEFGATNSSATTGSCARPSPVARRSTPADAGFEQLLRISGSRTSSRIHEEADLDVSHQ